MCLELSVHFSFFVWFMLREVMCHLAIPPTFHMTVSYLVAQEMTLKTYHNTQHWRKCAQNIMENIRCFWLSFVSGLFLVTKFPNQLALTKFGRFLFFFFVCLIESTQCHDKREQKISISIFLFLVLTTRKREISFQMAYNTIKRNWKKQISQSFLSFVAHKTVSWNGVTVIW